MVSLYPYQQRAIEALHKDFVSGHERCLICLPTGGGKTLTTTTYTESMWREWIGRMRVLWVVHRDELITQAHKSFQVASPNSIITHWDSKTKDDSGHVVLAMIGSTRRLKGEFDLVVVDEAHHLALPEDEDDDYHNMYLSLLDRVKWKRLLGLTASPVRLDERVLAFDKISAQYSFLDLVKLGRLSTPIYFEMRTKLKFDLLSRGGEFTETSLSQLDQDERNRKIIEEWVEERERYGKTLMFSINVDHAYHLAGGLNKLVPNCARVIDGKTPPAERKEILAWFADADFQTPKVLANCQVFVEGLDEPTIRTVFLTRPTKSKPLWLQTVGRGSRILTAEKMYRRDEILGRHPVGDDGVEEFDLAGRTIRGQVTNQNDYYTWIQEQVKNSFHLVSVMDDITKYPTLAQEWQLETRDPTPEEAERKVKEQIVVEKKDKLEELADQTGSKFEVKRAEVLDVRAVLIFSTPYDHLVGIPMDADRLMCLYRLKEVAEEAASNGSWDSFHDSYPLCVPNNELPARLFESMRWAYYHRYVEGRETITHKKTGKNVPTWQLYELDEMIIDGAAKAREQIEEAKKKNKDFNAKYYDDPSEVMIEVEELAKEMADDSGKAWALKQVLKDCHPDPHRPLALNRVFLLRYSGKVGGKELGFVKSASSLLTRAAQRYLDDPSILFRIRVQ